MTREDVAWSVATALAVLLCLGMLPFLPLLWLIERLDSLRFVASLRSTQGRPRILLDAGALASRWSACLDVWDRP